MIWPQKYSLEQQQNYLCSHRGSDRRLTRWFTGFVFTGFVFTGFLFTVSAHLFIHKNRSLHKIICPFMHWDHFSNKKGLIIGLYFVKSQLKPWFRL